MNWKPFNRANFEVGTFWVVVETPVVDLDVDDHGVLCGTYLDGTEQRAVLAEIY